jgi:phage baseplate assembly protein V
MDPVPPFTQQLALAAGLGVQLATVISLDDPESRSRVKVRLAAVGGTAGQVGELWARVATLFAGNDRGAFWMPDVNDEVVVAFVQGDSRMPIVLGGLWNGSSRPPETLAPANNLKVVRSRNGNRIVLDDTSGQERVIIETPGGNRVMLADGAGNAVTVEDSFGNSTTMAGGGVTVRTPSVLKIEAGAKVEVTAALVQVNAAMSRFSGVVQCDTLITNSVISASYTPGAGNIW